MNLIEKMKNIFKHNSEYLENEKEEILNGFFSCDESVSKIYFEAVSNEEASYYKLNLLQNRIFNTLNRIDSLASDILSHNDKCNEKHKLMLNFSILSFILEIASGIIFIGYPFYLVFLGGLLYFGKKAKDYKRCKFTTKEVEEIRNQSIYNGNTMTTSLNYIEKKRNGLIVQVANNPSVLISMYANRVIEEYLNKGVIEKIPDYIEKEIVFILQTELNTDEVNMYTLLNMARVNFKSAGLDNIIKRTREKKESN